MGAFWQQLAFVGHDAGHNGITHHKATDNVLGILVGNFFGGVSIAWWKRTHNVHHIVTNSVDRDPDIQLLPVLFDVPPQALYDGRRRIRADWVPALLVLPGHGARALQSVSAKSDPGAGSALAS